MAYKMREDMSEPIRELIARSSLGGSAWCANCKHADLLHEPSGCFGIFNERDESWTCSCVEFRQMTPAEYLAWKGESDV